MDQQQTQKPQTSLDPGEPKVNIPETAPVAANTTVEEEIDLTWRRYKCLVCGFLYEGYGRLKKCPKCGNEDIEKFTEAD